MRLPQPLTNRKDVNLILKFFSLFYNLFFFLRIFFYKLSNPKYLTIIIKVKFISWNTFNYECFVNYRYEKELPKVDIFVCTADPVIEPPVMVINTVLSVMAYDYPPENLSVYLSDDGGSNITYYALLEASHFAKHWLPYCKKFKVEPSSPAAYLISKDDPHVANQAKELLIIKVKNAPSVKEFCVFKLNGGETHAKIKELNLRLVTIL